MPAQAKTTPALLVSGWYGAAAATGGILFVVWGYLHRDENPMFLMNAEAPLALRLVALAVPLLLSVALIGIYVRLAGRLGALAAAGFVVAFCGLALRIVLGTVDAGPVVGPFNAYLLDKGLPSQFLGWLPLLLSGLLLIGVGTHRTRALSTWSRLLLALSLCGWIYQLTDSDNAMLRSVHVAFGLVFSLGWVALGCLLALKRGFPERQK